jgi:hypothetical protein
MKTKNKNMKIEVKEISLKKSDVYIPESYPSNGLYIVHWSTTPKKQNDYELGSRSEFVYRNDVLVYVLDSAVDVNFEEDSEIEEKTSAYKENSISESFALKMLSIATGSDKHKKFEL